MIKILKISIKAIIGFFIILLFLPFLISPIYNFPEPKPFSGDKIWNPYQNIDSLKWLKGNFQIQCEAWGGFTDGNNNPTDKVYKLYKKLNYDVIGISDYMKINDYFKDSAEYIAIYEHGYNARKTHQVSIGTTEEVYWLDFPLYQTTSHKQFILNQLRTRTQVLSIVHPDFHFEGYTHQDLKYLVNYDLLEALNHQRFSLSHWDVVLSNGHAKYILADDDAHDINNPFLVGVVATMLNANSNSPSDVVESLLSGRTYGYVPYTPSEDNYDKKAERTKSFPYLISAKLQGNSYTVKFTEPAVKVDFIGQNGEIMQSVTNSNTANYKFRDSDTYIRVEAKFSGSENKIYMNPIFRYIGDNPLYEKIATINWWKSMAAWLLAWGLFTFLGKKLWKF